MYRIIVTHTIYIYIYIYIYVCIHYTKVVNVYNVYNAHYISIHSSLGTQVNQANEFHDTILWGFVVGYIEALLHLLCVD